MTQNGDAARNDIRGLAEATRDIRAGSRTRRLGHNAARHVRRLAAVRPS